CPCPSDRKGFLGIVGIDSARKVTAYAPAEGTLLAIPKGKNMLLEGSIVLDETLGPERIVAVRCATSMPIARVVEKATQALEAAGGDPVAVTAIDLGCTQTSFLIKKVSR